MNHRDIKIIIIMDKWYSNVLTDRVLKELAEMGFKMKHISINEIKDIKIINVYRT